MVSVVAGTAREALGNVEVGKEAAQVLASIARADAEQSGENDRKEGTTQCYAAGQVFPFSQSVTTTLLAGSSWTTHTLLFFFSSTRLM